MIVIKFSRYIYKNNKSFYSIVVTSNFMSPKSGKFIEKLGYYDPNPNNWFQKSIYLDFNRLFYWLKKGVKLNKSLYLLIKPLLLLKFKSL
jgi:ribosomal protein S16